MDTDGHGYERNKSLTGAFQFLRCPRGAK